MGHAPWVPFEQLPKRQLEENLTVLRHRYPALYRLFEGMRPTRPIVVRREQSSFFASRLKTPSGWVPVHGDTLSATQEYQNHQTAIINVWQSGRTLLYLYQVGLGRIAHANLFFLKQDPKRRLLVVQDELSPLLAGMALYDFRPVFESDQVMWILGPSVHKRLSDQIISLGLEKHMYYAVIGCSHLAVRPNFVPTSEITKIVQATHGKHYVTRSLALWPSLNRYYKESDLFQIKRVLAIDLHPGLPGSWVLNAALKAMKRLGLETCIHKELPERVDENTFKNLTLHAIEEIKPDLILTISCASCDYLPHEAFEELRAPRVTYLIDHELPMGGRFTNFDIIIVTMSEMLGVLESYTGKETHLLPIVSHLEHSGQVTESLGAPVSFVGGISVSPEFTKSQRARLEQLRPGLWALAIDLIPRIARCEREASIYDIVDEAVKDLDPPLSPRRRSFFQYVVRIHATMLYRQRLLLHLTPFEPRIFAGDSVPLKPDSPLQPFLKGRIEQDRLADLYASSAINLHIHSVGNTHTPSNRVFNVAMANGFQLCDPLLELADFYRVSEEIPIYHSPEDLVEKVRYYLKHPAERREAAELSRKRTEQFYTYHHWVHRFFSIVERRLRERFDRSRKLELPFELADYSLSPLIPPRPRAQSCNQ